MDSLNKIIVILAFVAFGCIVIYGYMKSDRESENIRQNLKVISSVIKKTESAGYRGSYLRLHVEYTWKGELIKTDFSSPDTKCAVIGRELLLVIDSTNVENAKLLLKPEDFSEFNLTFPDSLNWTKECFKL